MDTAIRESLSEKGAFDLTPEWLDGVTHEMTGGGGDRKRGNRLWDDSGWVSKGQITQSLRE